MSLQKKLSLDFRSVRALPCLYCGVDSGPVLSFFLWIVGAGVLAFLSFMMWGRLTGKFGNEEAISRIPLEKEWSSSDDDSK